MPLSDPSKWPMAISAVSALAAVAAAITSILSANGARKAARQAAQQAHQAILRDLNQAVTTVVSKGARIRELVTRLKVARQTQYALAGQNVTAASARIHADEEKDAMAELMSAEAHALEMRGFGQYSDEELQTYARNMASYAFRAGVIEADLAGELEGVEAKNREARSRNDCPSS